MKQPVLSDETEAVISKPTPDHDYQMLYMMSAIFVFLTTPFTNACKALSGYSGSEYRPPLMQRSRVNQVQKKVSIAGIYVYHCGRTMKLIAFSFVFFCSLNAFSQNNKKTEPAISKAGIPNNTFPQSFIGNWKGQLQWMVAGKPTQQFTMQLGIQPADIAGQYTWQIIYGDSVVDNRPYLLKAVDAAKGHWIIDEKDGIILDSYVHGNAIHGAFTIQGKTIVDNYRVEKDQLFVEFFSIDLKDKKRSGKGTEKTPFVDSYRMGSYQMGVLFRVK